MGGDGGAEGMGPPGLQADSGPSWCNYKTLLDVLEPAQGVPFFMQPNAALPGGKLPFVPPLEQYIEEVIMALRLGPGDQQQQVATPINAAQSSGASAAGSGSAAAMARGAGGGSGGHAGIHEHVPDSPAYWVELLEGVIRSGVELFSNVGVLLFWIAVAGVFGRIPALVVDRLKDELSGKWYLLNLHVTKQIPDRREARDWVKAAIPVIFAQVFYRILCDAFEEDRKHLISNCTELLDKLTLVSHFEVIGFQINNDTVHRARRKLFVRNVIQNPQVNQLEFLKGLKRKEEIEGNSMGDQPLAFGQQDARPLEETQLEHVLQGRYQEKRARQAAAQKYGYRRSLSGLSGTGTLSGTPTSMSIPADEEESDNIAKKEDPYRDLPRPPPFQPPEGLGVETYEELSIVGSAMHARQQQALSALSGAAFQPEEEEEEEEEEELDDEMMSAIEVDSDGSMPASPASRATSMTGTASFRLQGKSLITPISTTAASTRPVSTTGASTRGDGGLSEDLDGEETEPESPGGTRVDSTATDTTEPLSPLGSPSKRWRQLRIARAVASKLTAKERKEREIKLRRQKHEALHKQAASDPLPRQLCERELLTTWVSPMTKRQTPAEQDRCILRKTASETYLLKMTANPLPMMNLALERSHSQNRLTAKAAGTTSAGLELPAASAEGPSSVHGVSITLEPPENLKKHVIMQRLDSQVSSFRKGTFAQYVKEYDVLTGEKRVRFDEARLRREEASYLTKMGSLVGGNPKRLIAPMGTKMRYRASTSWPSRAPEL